MKVEVKQAHPPGTDIKMGRLYQTVTGSAIVLCTSDTISDDPLPGLKYFKGVVIKHHLFPVGRHIENWLVSEFTEFKGEILLKQ